ncbi:GAF domain-containing protein, partial [Promineifilum sp.]|uniref:GAF domain-containing protein n=1 Tax=Promineifilum sp. TaxID=2664178 RepID=UPI0035B1ADE4
MTRDARRGGSAELFGLWQDVLGDLQDVFDVHFVCATFSYHVARHAGAGALVAVCDVEAKCYDIWITDPTGRTTQQRWAHEEAGLEALLARTEPAHLDKFEQPAAEVLGGRLWLLARDSLLIAPLPGGERPYNASPPTLLALLDPPPDGRFDGRTLHEVTRLMCVFLDRAALRQDSDRRALEFAVISDISRALSSTLNIQQIYELLTGPIRQTLNVETLSIGLIEPVTGDIVFVEKLFGPMFERLPPVRLKRGQGIAGWVAEHKEPVIITDAYADRRFFSGVDRRSGFRTHSMICIPLQVDERTIGVLQAINRQFGKFSEHDLQLMQALCGPLAAAIENANLHADVLAEKRRVETLFASMSEGLITVNRDGIITRANSAFASLVYSEVDRLIGSPLQEYMRLKKGDIDDLIGRILFGPDANVQLATDVLRDDGRALPVLISGASVHEELGDAAEAILVFSDLTQIREVERMRDDLFQGIIHELRTPLATILMYSRLL